MKVNTVVVGFDGSENAHRALETALELTAAEGVIHVVTAFHAPTSGETKQVLDAFPESLKSTYDPLAGPRSHLREAEAFVRASGAVAKGHFVEDHPAAAILDVAEAVSADMVVVGSRGLGRATRFLRGSVSSRVASHATTSFMVVHDGDGRGS